MPKWKPVHHRAKITYICNSLNKPTCQVEKDALAPSPGQGPLAQVTSKWLWRALKFSERSLSRELSRVKSPRSFLGILLPHVWEGRPISCFLTFLLSLPVNITENLLGPKLLYYVLAGIKAVLWKGLRISTDRWGPRPQKWGEALKVTGWSRAPAAGSKACVLHHWAVCCQWDIITPFQTTG